MRQPRQAVDPPLITFITMAYLRPQALARNLASVGRQTFALAIEQIVLPDHVGLGLARGLYGRLPMYEAAVHGRYVNILNDDDALPDENAVAKLSKFVEQYKDPPLVVTSVRKGETVFPKGAPISKPNLGDVDLGSYIVRSDIWRMFLSAYEPRYEGDFDFALAIWQAGITARYMDMLWAEGPAGGGRPEMSL